MAIGVVDIPSNAGAYTRFSPGNVATGLSEAVLLPKSGPYVGIQASKAWLVVSDASANIRVDGGVPTQSGSTNYGMKVPAGSHLVIDGAENLRNLRIIDSTAGDASVVDVTLYYG